MSIPHWPTWSVTWEAIALSHSPGTVGNMEMVGFSTSYRVHVDAKRRPTLPAAVLAAAGVSGSRELVVRADGLGRIVLEDPAILLAEFQSAVARGKAAAGFQGSLAEDLAADRAAEEDTAR